MKQTTAVDSGNIRAYYDSLREDLDFVEQALVVVTESERHLGTGKIITSRIGQLEIIISEGDTYLPEAEKLLKGYRLAHIRLQYIQRIDKKIPITKTELC